MSTANNVLADNNQHWKNVGVPIEKSGDTWMQTFYGHRVHILNPKPEEIFIEDIAHALSRQCRFGGHCSRFYSVAQHSILGVEQAIGANRYDIAREFLLHDATEAYVSDLIRPIKYQLPSYLEIEDNIWVAIAKRFNLDIDLSPDCKILDNLMVAWEKRDLLPNSEEWPNMPLVSDTLKKIVVWDPYEAEHKFLEMYRRLYAA